MAKKPTSSLSQVTVSSASSVSQVSSLTQSDSFSEAEVDTSHSNYLERIASNASSTDQYFRQINSISSEMTSSSAGISSVFAKMNLLNERIGLNGITISDNELINHASQSVAIDMIRVNNQKIKALAAKNSISGMSFRVKIDFRNYLNVKRAIRTDVTGINTHISHSNLAFNQGINTLNTHNSLVTSYSNQLSSDVNNASRKASDASTAASVASLNQTSASSAYQDAFSLVNRFQQQTASTARSNADNASLTADHVTEMETSAKSYSQQVAKMASDYTDNSSIADANSLIKSDLQTVNANHHFTASAASNAVTKTRDLASDDVTVLGSNFQVASQAASQASDYANVVSSAVSHISSAVQVASSIAAALYAERAALRDGARAYMPVTAMPPLDPEQNDASYIKYYRRGYQNAGQGFYAHLHQTITSRQATHHNEKLSYQIGFKDAGYFIAGVNDARKRVIKNNKFVGEKHYNFGYESYRKLMHSDLTLNKSQQTSVPLNHSLLLVVGFLIGSNN